MNTHAIALLLILLIALSQAQDKTCTKQKETNLRVVSDNEPSFVALQDVQVDAKIVDFLAIVEVTQTYVNTLDTPIEAVYEFPLDDKAAITQFKAEMDGRVIHGISKRKSEAKAEYDAAIEQKHTAYLMEQDTDDIFRMNVGNLPAGKQVKITVTYITELALETQKMRFVLPTTVGLRYGRSCEEHTTRSDTVPYTVNVGLDVVMSSEIGEVVSPSHDIKIKAQGNTARIELDSPSLTNGDLVIYISVLTPHNMRAWIEEPSSTYPDDEVKAALLSLYPSHEEMATESSKEKEIIFLLDTSGSMMHNKFDDLKRVMKVALDFLQTASMARCERKWKYNIITFDSQYTKLYPESKQLTYENINQAISFVEKLVAGGGTHVYEPLQHIFEQEVVPTSKNSIILVTDGQVMNTGAVLDLVKQNSDVWSVFSIGIGHGVSHELVNGAATQGNGVAEYILPNAEQVRPKMIRQLGRALGSRKVEIDSIDWGTDAKVNQIPAKLPVIYEDTRQLVYGFLPRDAEFVRPIKVTFKSGHTVEIPQEQVNTFEENETTMLIHKLAARELIRELQYGERTFNKEEIVALATRYNLMSSETSFIAVDYEAKTEGDMKRTVVPTLDPDLVQPTIAESGAAPTRKKTALRMEASSYAMHADAGPSYAQDEAILLLDVSPLSVGVGDVKGVFRPIVLRNSIIPNRKDVTMPVSHFERQGDEIIIRVYTGERAESKSNVEIGEIKVRLPDGYDEGEEVTITVDIDVNGIITVTARLNKSGFEVSQQCSQPKSLSNENIEIMIKEAEKYQQEDLQIRKQAVY